MPDAPRVGLIGPGRWGLLILRDLAALGAEVWAVALSAPSADAARAGGATQVVGSLDELPMLDGYVVATPEHTHLDIIEPLLSRGRPIFVEKPLDVDVQRARALPPAAHGLVFVMHKWRYHPGVEAMARIAASGELGAVRGLVLERLDRATPARKVGPIWILAPHDLSIALHVLGAAPRPVWAARHPAIAAGRGLMAMLETPGGVPVSLAIGVDLPFYRRNMVLGCEQGAVQLADPMDPHLTIARPGQELELRPISTELPLLRELRTFLEHLAGGPAPMTPLADELEMLQSIEQLIAMSSR